MTLHGLVSQFSFLIIAEFRTLLNSNFFFAFLVNSLYVHEIGTVVGILKNIDVLGWGKGVFTPLKSLKTHI